MSMLPSSEMIPQRVRRVSLTSTFSAYSTTAMSHTSSDQELLDTPADEYPSSISFDRKEYARGYDQECSAIFLPPDRRSPLQSHHSTRELISKYEAISDPNKTNSCNRPSHQSPHTPTAVPSHKRRDSPLPEPPSTRLKIQAPFSFRNLLTVFGKKNKSPKATEPESSQIDDVFLSSTLISRTGPALYLSYSAHLPSWRTCSLTLHPSHLVVTFSEDSRRITHIIPLLFCVDVVSLAGHQLGGEIPTPSTGEDTETEKIAHVFEMTFDGWGHAKERLAAWSVAERGRWVSATWDAILACRDPSLVQDDVQEVSSENITRGPLGVPSTPAKPDVRVSHSSATVSCCSSTPSCPTRVPPAEAFSSSSSQPSRSSIQDLGSMTLLNKHLATLDAKSQAPHASSLIRGVSSSGNYVSSSMRSQTRKDGDVICENHSQTLKPLHQHGQDRSTAMTDVDGTSRETFTALDAHAMYHEQPDDIVDGEIPAPVGKHPTNNEESQTTRDALAMDGQYQHLTRPAKRVDESGKDLHSLLTLLHGNAAEQSSQASGLAKSLASLDDSVGTILTTLVRGEEQAGTASFITKLDQIKNEIAAMNVAGQSILCEDKTFITHHRGPNESATYANESPYNRESYSRSDLSPVLMKLDELQGDLKGDLPVILQSIEALKIPTALPVDMEPVLAKLDGIIEATKVPAEGHIFPTALTEILTKLNGLVALCTSSTEKSNHPTGTIQDELVMYNVSRSNDSEQAIEPGPDGEVCLEPHPGVLQDLGNNVTTQGTGEQAAARPDHNPTMWPEQVTKLLGLLQDDQINREAQAKQQTDSVRYLNELNTWLETFVASNAGNMRQVVTGIDQICKEWLPVSHQADPCRPDSSLDGPTRCHSPKNTFASLRHFLAEQREKGDDIRDLQSAIHGLTETLREDMAKNAEVRSEMMYRAQIQENLLNELAAKLTEEIRGERLRFVDAMKDATSVNVAVHVEEFKKVLGRLHHEKMVLEQQISELFSFVARHKQSYPPQRRSTSTNSESRTPPRPLPQIKSQRSPPSYVIGDGDTQSF